MSNQESMGFRKGKRQAGSLPGFCTLLGINLSGKAAAISQLTWRTVMIAASATRARRPFILRNKNLTNGPISSSSLHHGGTHILKTGAAKASAALLVPLRGVRPHSGYIWRYTALVCRQC